MAFFYVVSLGIPSQSHGSFPGGFFLFTLNNISLLRLSWSRTHYLFLELLSEVTSTSPRLSYQFIWRKSIISSWGGIITMDTTSVFGAFLTALSGGWWCWSLQLLKQNLPDFIPSSDLCLSAQSLLLLQFPLLSVLQLNEPSSVSWICHNLFQLCCKQENPTVSLGKYWLL